jgi:hypothetical protein
MTTNRVHHLLGSLALWRENALLNLASCAKRSALKRCMAIADEVIE